MARRKKSSNPLGILIIAAIFLIIFTALVAIWIILGWLIAEIRYYKINKFNKKDFLLSQEDKNTLEELLQEQSEIENEINKILEEGKDLQRRQDGYFSERSNLGKQLNQQLIPCLEKGTNTKNYIEHIKTKPFSLFSEWKEQRINKLKYRLSSYMLILSAGIFYYFQPAWVIKFGEFIQGFSGVLIPIASNEIMGIFITATWISFIFYFVCPFIIKEYLDSKTHVPFRSG